MLQTRKVLLYCGVRYYFIVATSYQHVHQEKRFLSLWHPATIQVDFLHPQLPGYFSLAQHAV